MLIIDLHHLAWRAYYSTGSLSANGQPVGVIYGVLKSLGGIIEMFPDPVVVIAGDSKNSKRKEIFPNYKKRPKETDPIEKMAKKEAVNQIILLKKEILPGIGFANVFEVDGYEGDDIMAALVCRKQYQKKPVIVTGDEDLFQMLDYCNIWLPIKNRYYTAEDFCVEHSGLKPKHWSIYKALAGCSSDTVPGITGIGAKYAIQAILNVLPPGKKKDLIDVATKDGTFDLMKKLVTLPFPGLPEMKIRRFKFNQGYFNSICNRYEFKTLDWRI